MAYRLFLCCLLVSWCLQLSAEDIDKTGPPGSSFVFGDEFNTEVLDASIWGLGINLQGVLNLRDDYVGGGAEHRDASVATVMHLRHCL